LTDNRERAVDADVRDAVLQSMIDSVDVDLPDTLVDEEVEHRVTHAKERAEQAGTTLPDLLASQDLDELRFRAEARSHAIRGIKADLVLEAVARQEGLEVTAEEIGREIGGLAAALGRDPKDLAKSLDRTGQVVALAGDIIRSKALDFLVEHADIRSDAAAEEPTTEPEGVSEQPATADDTAEETT
jgi:trigger factor